MNMSNYSVLAPHGKGREQYEPLLAIAAPFQYEVVEYEPVTLEVRKFVPVITDSHVCMYATNGSPRDAMRHEARMNGERCRVYPYTKIGE